MPSRFAKFVLISLLSGSAFAQTLGLDAPRLFDRGMDALTGVGQSRSDQLALDNIHRAADLAYAPAEVVMGYFYETGTVVAADPSQAAEWYRKASKQGDKVGSWLLGRLYFTGSGVPRDLDQAEAALIKAAGQNDPYGQYLLGMVKLSRNDYVGAATWFRRAANQGIPQAQQQYGELLKDGKTGTADKSEAFLWLSISFDAGNQSAGPSLAELQGQLGATEVEKVKNKARDLEQVVTRAAIARGCTGWQGELDVVPAPPTPDISRFCR